MKVLEMPPLALKLNMLCLLLEKFASFTGQWISKSPFDLQRIITKLV
jgi:hypothetical protein